ncbi:MAG: GTP 3',8-cyclase MoaA [bacterium]|nr:GTP 3',8-cyclase MoaA [bacterium]
MGLRGLTGRGGSAAATELPDARGRLFRDLRISVTDRCNFRCPYCMPAEVFGEDYRFLPRKDILRFEEVLRVARLAVELGATKLRITGGEPLVRANLSDLIAGLVAIPGVKDLALTTNGVLLPGQAAALADAGLQRVTVSLDSLRPEVFQRTSGGRGEPEQVLAGIAAAEAAGLGPIKINCVVQRDMNQDDVVALARHFRGTGHIVRFIEFMDVGTMNAWRLEQVVPAREIVERVDAEFPLEPVDPNYSGEVARRYRYRDGSGEIGVIASVSEPFCGGCTRARLSAEGELVTCLFAKGGRDLKTPLRAGVSDATLREMIAGTWTEREDRYSEERSGKAGPRKAGERIEMYRIGG